MTQAEILPTSGAEVPDTNMKVSGNDDIEKIMNEIDELQGGMDIGAKASESSTALAAEIEAKSVSAPMDSEIAGLLAAVAMTPVDSESKSESSTPTQAAPVHSEMDEPTTEDSDLEPTWAPEGMSAVSMNVQGNVTVSLRHERTGQEVSIAFSSNEVLVSMGNGVEMKFPADLRASQSQPRTKTGDRPKLKVVA